MARFTRIDVVLKMRETGIIPVFYHKDPEICRNVIKHASREAPGFLNLPTAAILPTSFSATLINGQEKRFLK
jgi:hypothetical protein